MDCFITLCLPIRSLTLIPNCGTLYHNRILSTFITIQQHIVSLRSTLVLSFESHDDTTLSFNALSFSNCSTLSLSHIISIHLIIISLIATTLFSSSELVPDRHQHQHLSITMTQLPIYLTTYQSRHSSNSQNQLADMVMLFCWHKLTYNFACTAFDSSQVRSIDGH